MASSNREGGVRIFSDSDQETLEDTINVFLEGTDRIEDPKKTLIGTNLVYDGTNFVCLVAYRTFEE